MTEPGVEPYNHFFSGLETESKSGRSFHSSQTNFAGAIENFAEIGKQSHIEPGVYFPAILCIDEKRVAIAETEATIPRSR